MNRVTRVVVGLLALLVVLGFGGGLLSAVGVEGVAAAWVMFGVGLVWIVVTIWWSMRAPVPAQLADGARGRYLSFLRHAEYQPLDHSDENAKTPSG